MSQFGKTEALLIGTAFCMFLVCLYCLFFDASVFGLLGSADYKKSDQPLVGQITFLENDTRHQQVGTLLWQPAHNAQQVHLGDSVFTGSRSRSQVSFVKGGHVDLGENTLLVFGKVQNEEIPNFIHGNFRLQVKGEMKLAMDGEITQIKGDNSEVQIFMDKKTRKPQVKVLKGRASVKQGSAPAVELKADRFTALRVPASIPTPQELEKVHVLEPKTVQAISDNETLFYTDTFHDFYEKKDNQIIHKIVRPHYVNLEKTLSWTTQGDVTEVSGQLSSTEDFDKSVLPFKSANSSFSLKNVFLGENFWRLSIDDKSWFQAQKFIVKAMPLNVEPPKIIFPQESFIILNQPIVAKGMIEASPELSHFVLEYSRSPGFSEDVTRIDWRANKGISLKMNTPGVIYLRVRGVNQKMQITSFSDIVQLRTTKPELPTVPTLVRERFQLHPHETVKVNWVQTPTAKKYRVEITDKNGKVVEARTVQKNGYEWQPTKVGSYQMSVSSLDEWGRRSVEPAQATIQVKPDLRVIHKDIAKKKEPEIRKPSAVAPAESMISTSISNDSGKPNLGLDSSKLQVEGAVFTMHAQDQEDRSNVLAFTARTLNWWGPNGFEGSLKSKAASLSEDSNSPSPMQLEARYHHRWFLPFNLFSSGHTQFSLIAGYEFYRNPVVGYSPQYDLLKTGFSVDFPLFHRWDTGGEILYGYGLDSSTKYEISGRINYYLQRNWSMGVGYRIHLFQAGSDKSAPPMGVPYREGYGEGYSVLRWHY